MNTRPVKAALLVNAVFSGSVGLICLVAPNDVGKRLGVESSVVLGIFGAGLLAYGLALAAHAAWSARNGPRTLAIILLDLLWILSTVVVVVSFPRFFSVPGAWLMAGVATTVGALAFAQLLGLRALYRIHGRRDEYRLCISVTVEVSAADMWRVVSALGEISKYSPALRSSTLTGRDEPGVGARRTCEDTKGARWSELCTRWEVGRAFDLEFDAAADGFPFPFSKMRGGWIVDSGPLPCCTVEVWWEATPKPAWAAPLILPLMDLGIRKSFPVLIERMATSTRQGSDLHLDNGGIVPEDDNARTFAKSRRAAPPTPR